MDFTLRLAKAATIMTWLMLGLTLVTVILMDQLGSPPGVVVHLWAYLGWTVFGVVLTTFLTFLPRMAMSSHFVLTHITKVRGTLLTLDVIWASGGSAVTGGVHSQVWIGLFGTVLFAAVSMPGWQSGLISLGSAAGLVVATGVSHNLDQQAVAPLILVGFTFPIVAWFNSTLSAAVWDLRTKARTERKALESRVSELSGYLERAANGDLGVVVDSTNDTRQLKVLSTAFNHTIGNLRGLVGQIRTGGEQIGASAGQLLASAEEHAASATQQ
ncbi:MAG: methyl-accepting chemotaxis sensory transducer, partial [Frankiales bacterium]|nr:methyl-accepting chemotaxis sensory transducer [Frankiales bacterium]